MTAGLAPAAAPRPSIPPWRSFAWRHPEGAVAVTAVLAWVLVVTHEPALAPGAVPVGHVHPAPSEAVPGFATALGAWLVMSAAMMLPAALPAVREVALGGRWRRRQRTAALFTGAYLAVWALVGVVAWTAARAVPLRADADVVAAVLLVAAAGWQLSPARSRFLRDCRRLRPVPPCGRAADLGCLRTGAEYGLSCARACWALMAPMAVVGHAVPLMALLTAVAVADRLVLHTRGLRVGLSVLLLCCAGATASGAVT